ncbi:MAG: helix-turn-helix domain-containing protein [Bdellovibrionales bacterium]|nr:helix-turn-helix domain-containing protein [Bdellovibrionales bacterium]
MRYNDTCKKKDLIDNSNLDDINLNKNLLFDNFIWLTTKEAAEYLRTSPGQMRKWVYQGRVNAYKLLGKSLRFKKSELDHLIQGGRVWE